MTKSEIANLKAFAAAVIKGACEGSLDDADIQELAIAYGLVVVEAYDPTVHGEEDGIMPGEGIYDLSKWMKSRIDQ